MPTRPLRRLATLLVAATFLGGCTTADPSPSPSGPDPDALEVYRTIAADIVEIRGLDAPEQIEPRVIDAAELRANLEADFETSNPEAQLLLGERIYKALGLLPQDASLRDIYLDLQGSQVIGYYDPAVDELFIVSRSGRLGPTERVTYAHEFTHELQDKAFDIESLGLDEAFDEGDRALAVLALVEGDASSAQTTWMLEHLTPAELGEVAAEASDPDVLEVLGRTPAILLETSFFPYQAGAVFVGGLIAEGGYEAVNAAFDRLPESTEQILHPQKYEAREVPVDVEIRDDLAADFGSGWTLDAQDTLGELQLKVWLREGGLLGDVAREAVDGWGGDRIALLAAPDSGGDVIVISTAWDSAADAREFRDAAVSIVERLGRGGSVVIRGDRVVVAVGEVGPQGASLDAILVGLATDPG